MRIARELHDVIGHSVSVMTVQASAVRRRLTPDQGEERQALESVEAVGREALAEMRRMVGALRERDEGADQEPAPGLDQLRPARRAVPRRRAGRGAPGEWSATFPRAWTRPDGVPPDPGGAHQRAPPRRAADPCRRGGDLRRTSSWTWRCGTTDSRNEQPAEAGHGLLGMKERVSVYGGELVARPLEHGFELAARLPLDAEAGVSWATT